MDTARAGSGETGHLAHFALIAPPYAGHINPMLAIAAALHARGQRATLLHTGATPAAPEGVATLRLDLPPPGPVPFSPLPAVRLTQRRTASLLRVLPGVLRGLEATALVVDQLEPAGALAAASLGLPWVTVANALAINREPGVPPPFTDFRYRADAAGARRNLAGWRVHDLLMRPLSGVIADWARAHGLPQRDIDDTFSPRAQLSQMVPGLDFPRAALPAGFHYVGPLRLSPPPPSAPRRLVFASLGTLQGHRAALFHDIARAAQACAADLGIAHGGRLAARQAAALPGRPVVRDFVPQAEVLAQAAALVGHGGMNTVMDALAAGVPAVLVPLAFEQAAIAARVVRAGAGIVVPGRAFRARRLRWALEAVLEDPAYRQAAAVLQGEVAQAGGAARAADIIIRAAG